MPVRIKAQALRRRRATASTGAGADTAPPPWRQEEVTRAITAAKEAGLEVYRVEIAPDGTISIVVGTPAETAEPDPYGDLLRPQK